MLEKFLVDFDRFAAVSRVYPVDRERIVEKEVNKAVLVPTKDSETLRNDLAYSLLIEKLFGELKKIKKDNPNIKFAFDEDIGLYFNSFFDGPSMRGSLEAGFADKLKEYTQAAVGKFEKQGGSWTSEHLIMLNTVLEERFAMANLVKTANLEIEKAKSISNKRAEALKIKEN